MSTIARRLKERSEKIDKVTKDSDQKVEKMIVDVEAAELKKSAVAEPMQTADPINLAAELETAEELK
jgi:hypothetical protein